jgi:hypothetical protein
MLQPPGREAPADIWSLHTISLVIIASFGEIGRENSINSLQGSPKKGRERKTSNS